MWPLDKKYYTFVHARRAGRIAASEKLLRDAFEEGGTIAIMHTDGSRTIIEDVSHEVIEPKQIEDDPKRDLGTGVEPQ